MNRRQLIKTVKRLERENRKLRRDYAELASVLISEIKKSWIVPLNASIANSLEPSLPAFIDMSSRLNSFLDKPYRWDDWPSDIECATENEAKKLFDRLCKLVDINIPCCDDGKTHEFGSTEGIPPRPFIRPEMFNGDFGIADFKIKETALQDVPCDKGAILGLKIKCNSTEKD